MMRRNCELEIVQQRLRLLPLVRQLTCRRGTHGSDRLHERAICAVVVTRREIARAGRLIAALLREPVGQRMRLLARDRTTLTLLDGGSASTSGAAASNKPSPMIDSPLAPGREPRTPELR